MCMCVCTPTSPCLGSSSSEEELLLTPLQMAVGSVRIRSSSDRLR